MCGSTGRGVSVHPTMPRRHLTAKVQHSHTRATPLWCLFSPMHPPVLLGRSYMCCKIWFGSKIMTRGPRAHSILMHDAWLKECVYVQWATQERCTLLCMSLLEVKGTSGQLSYFHRSSFDKTPAEGNGGAPYTFVNSNRCSRELIKGRGLPTGDARESTLWQLKNYHFINSMHYLYWAHILSWLIHLQWPWVITLGYSRWREYVIMFEKTCSTFMLKHFH